MTKTEKLQSVEQRIRKLVPRLQELSFGCMYRVCKGKRTGEIGIIGIITNEYGEYYASHDFANVSKSELLRSDWYEIIGHPIDIEAVLEAIKVSIDHGAYRHHYFVQVCDRWQYGKPLSEQSDELIDFLFSTSSELRQ